KDLAATFSGGFASNLTAAASALAGFLRIIDNFMQKYPDRPWWTYGTAWSFIYPLIAGEDVPDDGVTFKPVAPTGGRGASGGGSAGGRAGGVIGATADSVAALIEEAKELKRRLDAATTPQAWIDANR